MKNHLSWILESAVITDGSLNNLLLENPNVKENTFHEADAGQKLGGNLIVGRLLNSLRKISGRLTYNIIQNFVWFRI
jgi:hypothetical protein